MNARDAFMATVCLIAAAVSGVWIAVDGGNSTAPMIFCLMALLIARTGRG